MRDYNKGEAVSFGKALGNLVSATRDDGVGPQLLDELISTMTTSAKAMNEIKGVPEAAAEHILSGMTDAMGDAALARAQENEPPPAASVG